MSFILIKFGGNAMVSDQIKNNFCKQIKSLKEQNYKIVIVHGGGPFIQEILDEVGLKSDFINGHRYTDEKSLKYIEMALSGQVNGELVTLLNNENCNAVGLSGKDTIIDSVLREDIENGKKLDLGRVGDVKKVNIELLNLLLNNGFTPVVSPISTADDGDDVNINADMLAGHIAGALGVDSYIVLTDVDGLYSDFSNKSTLIKSFDMNKITEYKDAIVGGMLPKIDSIKIALENGAKSALILNGSSQNRILDYLNQQTDVGSKFF